jgi:hypothetical protein
MTMSSRVYATSAHVSWLRRWEWTYDRDQDTSALGGVNAVVTKPDGQSSTLYGGFTYNKHD